MSWPDWLAEVFEACFRMVPVPARTGLRIIGRPDRSSPVFLTGNYDLTVRRVRRALRGLDAYLVVANSHGVNVWCAASGGHLGTHQVVTALKVARLEERVVHREVIVPQLAATGIEGKQVRRRTGWIVRFGPADAKDIPAYLAADKKKTEAMRLLKAANKDAHAHAAAVATMKEVEALEAESKGAAKDGASARGQAVVLEFSPCKQPIKRGPFSPAPFGAALKKVGGLASCGT